MLVLKQIRMNLAEREVNDKVVAPPREFREKKIKNGSVIDCAAIRSLFNLEAEQKSVVLIESEDILNDTNFSHLYLNFVSVKAPQPYDVTVDLDNAARLYLDPSCVSVPRHLKEQICWLPYRHIPHSIWIDTQTRTSNVVPLEWKHPKLVRKFQDPLTLFSQMKLDFEAWELIRIPATVNEIEQPNGQFFLWEHPKFEHTRGNFYDGNIDPKWIRSVNSWALVFSKISEFFEKGMFCGSCLGRIIDQMIYLYNTDLYVDETQAKCTFFVLYWGRQEFAKHRRTHSFLDLKDREIDLKSKRY